MVARHLGECWECRARLAGMEQQALALAKAGREESFLPPERILGARQEMLRRLRAAEHRLAELPAWHPARHPRLVRGLALAAALLVVGAFGLRLREGRPVPPVSARSILAEARHEEQRQFQAPGAVHAAARVEFVTGRHGPPRAGRLEVWMEPVSRRYALRWYGGGGELRHAVWRADGMDRVYFAAAVQPSPAYPEDAETTLADLRVKSGDPGAIEAAFVAWLARWRRQPLNLLADFAAFAGRSGAVLRVEWPSAQFVRLVASQPGGAGKVEFLAELEAASRRLRRLLVRWETATGAAEIHLAVEVFESVPLAQVADTVFQPEVPEIPRAAARTAPRVSGVPAPPPAPTHPDTERLELEARYVLHRWKACLGEPLEVVREAAGRVRVRGFSPSEERRDQLTAALAKLAEPDKLAVDIQVPGTPPAPALPLGPESAAHSVRGARLPVEALLDGYFSQPPPAGPPAGSIFKLANDALEGAEAALAEAWAFRRLAERYPPEADEWLSPESRLLLDRMRRDHLAALWSRLSETRAVVEQPLAYVRGQQVAAAEPQAAGHTLPHRGLLAAAEEINRRLRLLFAGDEDLTQAAGTAPGGREAIERAAAEALAALDRLEVEFRRVETELFGSRRAGEVSTDREP